MAYDDLLKRIGSRIRQRRKELGITQEELAGSEYTKSFISKSKRDRRGRLFRPWPTLLRGWDGRSSGSLPRKSPIRALHEIAREVGLEPEQVLLVLAAVLRKL